MLPSSFILPCLRSSHSCVITPPDFFLFPLSRLRATTLFSHLRPQPGQVPNVLEDSHCSMRTRSVVVYGVRWSHARSGAEQLHRSAHPPSHTPQPCTTVQYCSSLSIFIHHPPLTMAIPLDLPVQDDSEKIEDSPVQIPSLRPPTLRMLMVSLGRNYLSHSIFFSVILLCYCI